MSRTMARATWDVRWAFGACAQYRREGPQIANLAYQNAAGIFALRLAGFENLVFLECTPAR